MELQLHYWRYYSRVLSGCQRLYLARGANGVGQVTREVTITTCGLFCLVFLLAISPSAADQASSIRDSKGFRSVSEALHEMSKNSASKISIQDGWTIIALVEKGNYVMWSFTPDSHSAHPSAVRREIVEKDGQIYIAMQVLCESSKPSCDKLVQQFELLNQSVVSAND